MQTNISDFSKSIKEKMVLVSTSTLTTSNEAAINIFHLKERKFLYNDSIYAKGISDNVAGFFGIGKAMEKCQEISFDAEIFCPNTVSVSWIRNLKCNPQVLSQNDRFYDELMKLQLFVQNYQGKIMVRNWLPKWGNIKFAMEGFPFDVNYDDIPEEVRFDHDRFGW